MKVKKRECGECTLCCKLLDIPWMESLPNTYCSKCEINKGCTIFKSVPKKCSDYNCEYLKSETMGDELKPNVCNVIFEEIAKTIHLALVDPDYINAWKEEPVMNHISKLNDNGISVIVSSYSNEPKIIFPTKGRTHEEVMSEVMDIYNKEYL
tara:strand:+ start:93657 stop:94112 length:456 start_codon:yes stop_codon:yes gene_type:complete